MIRTAETMAANDRDLFFESLLDLFKYKFCQKEKTAIQISFLTESAVENPERLGECGFFLAADSVYGNRKMADLKELNAGFRESFLNYTPEFPDHWICTRNVKRGFTDLPHNGGVLALCNLLMMEDGLDWKQTADEIVLPYAEFLAAMLPRIPEKELKYAFLFLETAAFCMPERPELKELSRAVQSRCNGIRDVAPLCSPYSCEWCLENEPGKSVFHGC